MCQNEGTSSWILERHCSKMVFTIDITSVMLTTPSPLTSSPLDENTTIILEFGIIWAVNRLFLTDLVTSNPLISTLSNRQPSSGVNTKVFSVPSQTTVSPMLLANSKKSLMVTFPWSEQARISETPGIPSIRVNLLQSAVDWYVSINPFGTQRVAFVQFWKASSPVSNTSVIQEVTDVNDLQPEKALFPMESTEFGMTIDVNALH